MTEGGNAEAEVEAFVSTSAGEESLGEPPVNLHTSGSALTETSEGDTGKRKREPITWRGEETKARNEELSALQASSPKRLRPNPAFLNGLVSGMKKTNQRLLAETATSAACQEITAAAANGAKVQFDRIPQDQPAKFRKLALSVAAQVNFATCAAVLKEVAAHYGFALAVDGDDKMEPLTSRQAANGSTHESADQEEGEERSDKDGDDVGLAPVRQPKPMSVRLAEHPPEEPLSHRKRHVPQMEARPKPSLPQIALNNRLAGAALSALTGHRSRKVLPRSSHPLAMDATRHTKPVHSTDDGAAREDPDKEASSVRASVFPGEEALEGYEEGSEASELLVSDAEGNKKEEEDLHVPLSRFGGLRADRTMRAAPATGQLREPGLDGPGDEDIGALLRADRGGPLKKAPAAARLSGQQKPKRRNGLFGAAMDGLGK